MRSNLTTRPALAAILVPLLAGFTAGPGAVPGARPGAASTATQTVTLDEGSFRLFLGGSEVGTETFTVRQNGTGASAVIIAQGRTVLTGARGGEEVTASLEVGGTTLRPAAYQVTVQGAEPQRIAGRVVGGRFSARIVSPAGEAMREYLAGEGAIVVDEGVAHHYYFLARRLDGAAVSVPLIIPRQNRQVSAQVTPRGEETIAVDGRNVQARRFNVAPAGLPVRHLWVDAQGRVLRVDIPDTGFRAVRAALPR
jgi:hypothetical protein